jgi:hypothetical protein
VRNPQCSPQPPSAAVAALVWTVALVWLGHRDAIQVVDRMDRNVGRMDRAVDRMDHAVERMDQDTETTFAIGWKGQYRIEGSAFVYMDGDTGRATAILGYPTQKLAPIG